MIRRVYNSNYTRSHVYRYIQATPRSCVILQHCGCNIRNNTNRWLSSVIPDSLSSSINLSGQLRPPPPAAAEPLPTSFESLLDMRQQNKQQQKLFVGLPTRHSRKLLPPVITDMVELTEMASEIIESGIGQLYTYNEYATNKKEATTRNTAWDIADTTVQKVEAIIRGLAYLAPGTMWNRWTTAQQQQQAKGRDGSSTANTQAAAAAASNDFPPSDILILQQQLVDRLMDEGLAYMNIRNIRMEDMYGKKGAEKLPVGGMFDAKGNLIPIEDKKTNRDQGDTNDASKESKMANEQYYEEDDEDKEDSYLYDFAPPGPTTAMYDTILDTLACTASKATDRYDTLQWGQYVHEMIMTRHTNDGGDTLNDNEWTRPTAVSFNALIRICAELPYDSSVNISAETAPLREVQYRDDVVGTFVGTLHLMHECGVVHRNSASFRYALDCVAKYMPPSRIRGNISTGLFHQARYACIVNDAVVASYINANVPSNDEWNDNFIRTELQSSNKKYPDKWKRDSRKLQYHPKEDTY